MCPNFRIRHQEAEESIAAAVRAGGLDGARVARQHPARSPARSLESGEVLRE